MGDAAREVFDKHGRVYQKDEAIFKDGSVGEVMYIIQRGSVRITKEIMGEEKLLAVIKAPDFFGEMSIIDNDSRSANAISDEDGTHLIVCNREVFENQICKNPKFAVRIMKKLSSRLRAANRKAQTLMQKSDTRKVICHFITVSYNAPESNGKRKISNSAFTKDMYNSFGVEAVSVEEAFGMLQKANLATISGDDILLSCSADLQKFLDYLEMKERFE